MRFFTLMTALAATASAYKVLTPTTNSTVTKGTEIDVKWTTVDTDASTFSIYLVNFQTAHWPPTVLSLAQNVPQKALSQKVRIPCDLSSDYGWQLNFINGTNTYVIYAQSPVFSLTGSCVEPTPTPTPAPKAYGNTTVTAVQTVVQTVVIETPVVWFVQPTNLVSAAAVCPPGPQKTVTVYANGASPTPYAPSAGVYRNGTSGAPVTKTATPSSASTGLYRTSSSSLPVFTGAAVANKVGGVAVAMLGAAAMLL